MVDIIKPITPTITTQVERRCSHTVCSNDLDAPASDPVSKYGVMLMLWDEPQGTDGKQTGLRVRAPDKPLPIKDALERNFTAAGVTLPGAAILALFNEIVDAYKGD